MSLALDKNLAPASLATRCARPIQPSLKRRLSLNRGGEACCSSAGSAATESSDRTSKVATAPVGGHPDAASWKLLQEFTQKQFRGRVQQYLSSAESRCQVKEALLAAYSQAYPPAGWTPPPVGMVLLGVMASDARLAVRALRDYCQALDLAYVQPECKVVDASSLMTVRGGVYVKYNSVSKVCYLSRYQGQDRGVLVQLGDLQFGHFPLGMFDESMAAPPPSLH